METCPDGKLCQIKSEWMDDGECIQYDVDNCPSWPCYFKNCSPNEIDLPGYCSKAKCFYKPKPINPGPINPPTNWIYMAIPIILCLIICALLFRKYRDKVSYCFRSFGRTFTRQEQSIAMLPLAENRLRRAVGRSENPSRSNYFALLSDSDTSDDSERTPIIRNAR